MEKEQKIPSPQEITGEVKKFTPEEITNLKSFQSKLDQLVTQLGRLGLSRIRLDEQESELKVQLKSTEKEEQELAAKLSDKYGRGSLDIETGTFTPTK
tara:strand:+ start:254 stop:547 length:294 start_codon:yes stop_codon:yes gene_type:complete